MGESLKQRGGAFISPAKDIEIRRRRKTISLSFDIVSAIVGLFSSESMLPVPFWLFSEEKNKK
jgi:hypothetical protein